MDVRELLGDDGAVSPVIGVILMVAITVILAAVIAAFVLGLGDTSNVAPQVSLDYDYTAESSPGNADGELTAVVSSGDSFTAGQVELQGTSIGGNAGQAWNQVADDTTVGSDSTVGAGERATLTGLSDDFELDIVWTAEGGGDSSTIASRTGPDA
jgi:flagellin-like protein